MSPFKRLRIDDHDTWIPFAEFMASLFRSQKLRGMQFDESQHDDLVAAAIKGVWRASVRWRPDGGASFATFAAAGAKMYMRRWMLTPEGPKAGHRSLRAPGERDQGQRRMMVGGPAWLTGTRPDRPHLNATDAADLIAVCYQLVEAELGPDRAKWWREAVLHGRTHVEIAAGAGVSKSLVQLHVGRATKLLAGRRESLLGQEGAA